MEKIIFYLLDADTGKPYKRMLTGAQFFFAFRNLDYNGFGEYLDFHGKLIELDGKLIEFGDNEVGDE